MCELPRSVRFPISATWFTRTDPKKRNNIAHISHYEKKKREKCYNAGNPSVIFNSENVLQNIKTKTFLIFLVFLCPCRCPFCCLSLFIYVRFQFEKPENNFGWKTGTPGTRETSATKWGKRSQSQAALSTWAMPKKKEGKNTNETSKWYCGKKKEQKNRMEMSRQRWNILQQLLTEERTHTHTYSRTDRHTPSRICICVSQGVAQFQ